MSLLEEIIDVVIDIFAWIVTLVYFVLLVFAEIESWFDDYHATQVGKLNADEVGFTLLQAMNDPATPRIPGVFNKTNSNYVTVQGVFDKNNQKVTAARKIESNSIDNQLAQNHQGSPVAIYT